MDCFFECRVLLNCTKDPPVCQLHYYEDSSEILRHSPSPQHLQISLKIAVHIRYQHYSLPNANPPLLSLSLYSYHNYNWSGYHGCRPE